MLLGNRSCQTPFISTMESLADLIPELFILCDPCFPLTQEPFANSSTDYVPYDNVFFFLVYYYLRSEVDFLSFSLFLTALPTSSAYLPLVLFNSLAPSAPASYKTDFMYLYTQLKLFMNVVYNNWNCV